MADGDVLQTDFLKVIEVKEFNSPKSRFRRAISHENKKQLGGAAQIKNDKNNISILPPKQTNFKKKKTLEHPLRNSNNEDLSLSEI